MSLSPDINEILARARADLRMGLPVVLGQGDQGLVLAAVETISASKAQGLLALPEAASLVITARRAETLKARAYDGDLARLELPTGADLAWMRVIADPKDDLNAPMKGPLVSRRGGDATLPRLGLFLLKAARLLPAGIAVPVIGAEAFAREHGLTYVAHAEAEPHLLGQSPLVPVVSAKLPLEVSEAGRLHVFRPADGNDEHYAIEIGKPDRGAPVLARLHSACFTGDLLGSLKCDCGPQLRAALAQMGAEGAGVLLYLNQEGRGIGLANKMRAYALQRSGV